MSVKIFIAARWPTLPTPLTDDSIKTPQYWRQLRLIMPTTRPVGCFGLTIDGFAVMSTSYKSKEQIT